MDYMKIKDTPTPPGDKGQLEDKSLKRRFKENGPTDFEGPIDPIQAKKWKTKLGKMFDVLGCSDQKKVNLTSFLLQGDIDRWRKTTNRTYESTAKEVTWSLFKNMFDEKFIPANLRDQKLAEFLSALTTKN